MERKTSGFPNLVETRAGLWQLFVSFVYRILGFEPPPIPLESVSVVRPSDLLVLRFEFENLWLKRGSKTRAATLSRREASEPAFIVVTFPPQSIGEEAFYEVADGLSSDADSPPGSEAPTIPARGEFADASRVGFELPASFNSAPFTLESLLSLWCKDSGVEYLRVSIEAPY